MFNKVFNKEFNRESKLTKITALVKNLLTQNSRCLESLKSLKGLIENPWEISHFKNEIGNSFFLYLNVFIYNLKLV